jgi:hypothetical protein
LNAILTEIAGVLQLPQNSIQALQTCAISNKPVKTSLLAKVKDFSAVKLIKPKGSSFAHLGPQPWSMILEFLDLRDMFTIQSLCIKLQSYVNPSSVDCLV